MAQNTDLNPVATDPSTGYHTYELLDPSGQTRKVNLWAASSFVEQNRGRITAAPELVSSLERRMRLLYDRYNGRELDPTFAMDMIASNLSDQEMVQLYDQRFAFTDRPSGSPGFWKQLTNAFRHPFRGPANEIGRAIPGDSQLERSFVHPVDSLTKTLDYAYDATMNNLARGITGDKDMTFHGLFATGVMTGVNLARGESIGEQRQRLGYDSATHTFHDPETGEQMGVQDWIDHKAPGWVKAADFGGYFIDPFMFMAAVRTARVGARTVRGVAEASKVAEAESGVQAFMRARREGKAVWGAFKSMRAAREAKSVESFAGRRFGWWGTTVEDVDRLSKGELQWSDYLKGVNLREIMATKVWPTLDDVPKVMRDLGFEPKTWRYFEEAALTGNVHHIRALAPKAPGWWMMHQAEIVKEGRGLGKATKEIAEDLRQEWVKLYDPAEVEGWDARATEMERRWAGAKEELDILDANFFDPLEMGAFPLSEQEKMRALQSDPEAHRAFSEASRRERQYRVEMIRERQAQGSLAQVIDTIPRHTVSAAFRTWMDNALGVEFVGELGTSESILDRVAHKGARSLKNVMAYNPHRAVDITDDFSHEQFQRLLDGVHLDVPGWSKGDSATYFQKYLKAADDNERFTLMEQLSNDVYSRLGFNEKQIERIRQEYAQWWGRLSDKLSITSPRNLTIMDPHLIRKLAKMGPKALEPHAFTALMEKSLSAWKKLAITRPAWFFRVVMLSEQPRLAMAGAPNLITHPLVALASTQVPGASNAARKLLDLRLAVPGWKSKITLNYQMLDDLLSGSDMGMALGRSERAAAKSRLSRSLGTLGIGGQPTTSQLFHLDDVVTDADRIGYVRGWAEILNNRLPSDPLHARFLDGATLNDAKNWAHSNDATAWRKKHGLEAGTDALTRQVGREKKFFDTITRKDPEIIEHIRSGAKFHWKDLVDLKPPDALPLDVFAGRADRPGLALSRTKVQSLMQPVFDSFSSNPSFWMGRFPAYRLGYAEEASRYVNIYSRGEPLKNALEVPLESFSFENTLKARDSLHDVRATMTDTEHDLWVKHVGQSKDYKPQTRAELLEELQHNVEHRTAVQAFLDDMGVPDEVVLYRGGPASGDPFGEGTAVNATLDYRIAQREDFGGGPGKAVHEIRLKRSDIISIGSGEEHEVLFWRRDAVLPGHGGGITDPTASMKRILAHGEGKPGALSAMERRIAEWAHQRAAFKVRQALYDLNESSRVADIGRFVAPFGNAWQEEITRWATLGWQRPLVPAGLMTAWRHKEDLPFSYKDPKSGDTMYFVPWSQHIVRAATGAWNPITGAPSGISMPLSGRWKNLNIITGSGWLPGAGPFTTIPAKLLSRAPGGLGHVFQGVASTLDPYGGTGLSADDLLPSPFFRAAKSLEDDPASDASLAHAVVVYNWNRTNGKITPEDETRMEEQLRALKVVNAATQITIGSGIKVRLAPKLQEMVDYMKWATHSFGSSAQTVFLDRYGDDAAAYMVNLTKSMTGAPPTKEAEEMLLRPENKRWARSKAFWAVMAEQARGEWDPIASAAQVARGDREARGIHELTNAAYTITGWYRYGIEKQKYVAALTRAGLTTRSQGPLADAIKSVFEGKRQAIFDAYPGFQAEFEQVDYNAWRQNMRDLSELVNDPVSAGLRTTQGAQAFFAEVEKVGRALRAAGLGSLSSKEAEPYRRIFDQKLDLMFRQYPEFRLVYYRLGLDGFDGREGDFPSAVQREQ